MEFGNIGVFLCSCGRTLNLNLRGIARELSKLEEVSVVERVERLCTEEGLSYLVDDLRRKELDKIVVGACTSKNALFEEVASKWGIEPLGVEIVNIREHCAWVHDDRRAATEKAKAMLRHAVKRAPELPEVIEVRVEPSILIAGDARALELADELAELELETHILCRDQYFKRIEGLESTYSPKTKGSFLEFKDAEFHMASEIKGIEGELGDYKVEIEIGRHIDASRCVDCERCVEACVERAITRPGDATLSTLVIGESCNGCGECAKICPTGAVKLEKERRTLNVAQVISFYPVEAREGVYRVHGAGGEAMAYDAALRALMNVRGYRKESLIRAYLEKCANKELFKKKLDVKGCTYCKGTCAYYPVASAHVSDIACKGCGTCAASCPMGALELKLQPFEEVLQQVEAAAEAKLKRKLILFTCAEGGHSAIEAAGIAREKHPAYIPVHVPCLGSVSELHILRAFDAGAEGVVLLGCGGRCMYSKGYLQASRRVAIARKVLDFFGVSGSRVRMLRASAVEPASFARQLAAFDERLGRLGKSPLGKKGPAAVERDAKGRVSRRELLYALLSSFSEKTGVREGVLHGLQAGMVSVDEKECTLCGSCAFHCGTGALRHEGKDVIDIFYTHTTCIGCGLCQELCPEKALTFEEGLHLVPFLAREERKIQVKVIECAKCGKPLMAEAAFRKLSEKLKPIEEMPQLCQDCLDKETIADLLGTSSEDIVIFQQGKAPWE